MIEAGAAPSALSLRGRVVRMLPALLTGQVISLGALLFAPAIIATLSGHPATGADAVSISALADRLHYWDGNSYIAIASHGYPLAGDEKFSYLNAFLPGYPMLIRAVTLLGVGPAFAGVIISVLCEAVSLVALDLLVSAERDDRTGLFAVWWLALLPFGVFLSLVYTESAFIAATAVTLLLARRGQLGWAAVAATAASSVRITGLVLGPVLLVEWFRHAGFHWRPRPGFTGFALRRLATIPVLGLPALPFLLFSLYLGAHSGDINAFRHAQTSASFNHDLAWPWDGFWSAWNTSRTSVDPENGRIFFREVAAGVLGLLACIFAWGDREFPTSFAVYCSLVWVVSTSLTFWLSIPRYLLAMFPLVIVVGDLTARQRWLRPVLVAAGAGGLLWSASLYSVGHWLA